MAGRRGSIVGDVSDNGTLVFDRSDSVTFGGSISGTGSLTQNGSGTLILSGTNNYSGNTNVNVGTLLVDGSLGAGLVNVASGATLGGTGTIGGPVTIQNGGILAPGDAPGTLTMGTLTLNSGSILNCQLGIPNVVGGGVNDLVNVNGNLTLAGTLNITNVGGFGEGVYRLFNYTGSLTNNGLTFGTLPTGFTDSELFLQTSPAGQINLLVSASGFTDQFWDGTTTTADGIIHGGSGTWDNVTTNWTNLDAKVNAGWQNGFAIFEGTAGTVTLGANISFIGMQFITDGYTITAPGSQTLIAAPGTIIRVDSGVRATIAAPIVDGSTPGSLTKTDLGTLILTGTNTYSGGTTISAGTLQLGNGGTSGSILGNVIDNGVFAINRSDTFSFGGLVSGTGTFQQLGTGTTILTGTNTYSGGTTISGGTLQLGKGGTSGSILDNVVDNGVFAINRSDTFSFGGLISGTGTFQQLGTGTTILTGTSTYGGGTTISAGTLQLGNGGTSGSILGNVVDNGVFAINRSDAYTFAGNISGTGAFQQLGTGVTILTGANTYTGGTTISAGTLQLGAGSATGSIVGAVVNNSTFDIVNANTAGITTITNNGITNFLNTSTAGNATITTNSGGATEFFGTSTGGQARFITNSGGTVDISGLSSGGMTAGSIKGAGTYRLGSKALTVGLNDLSTEVSGTIADGGLFGGTGGALIKVGTGTLTLTGANTYTGGTNLNGGILAIKSNGNLGTGSLSFNGGTLEALASGGGITSSKAITLNAGGGAFLADAGTSSTLSGAISGAGSLTKAGAGTLILAGANTYSGATNVALGTLQAGSPTALSPNSTFNVTSELNLNGFKSTIGSLSGTGTVTNSVGIPATLTIGGDNTNTTFSGTLTEGSGNLGFAKLGNGTLILTGESTYTGGTTITVGTLQIGDGGTSGSIAGDVSDSATLAFDRSDSVTFGGVISGTGALVQKGSGTLTLTADNTYTGGTMINAGTLQLGHGGMTGSIIGNVTDNGSLLFNRSNNVTFNTIISGSGNLVQNGSGTTILGGANTYSGGTIINAGALLVNNSQALGLGDVVVNGGILGADPQPINVKGNYTQNAGGTLQLQVSGADPGQYDTLNAGGNAVLGGTLQLISLGFQPKAGNQLTLVTSAGAVSGQFARFVDPFSVRPGLNTIDLIYGRQSVVLEFLNQTTPISPVIPTVPTVPTSPSVVPPTVIATINFTSFALTPNQSAAANLLDAVQLDPRAAALISFLDKEPFATLPRDLNKISPDGLTAFYEISFSNANIQRLNLESRLDDLHNGSNGFSSNMKLNGATVNPEEKASVDGKTSKAVVEPILQPGPENRWGVWVTGFGDFVNVDGDGNAKGYDFTTGGVSVGVDYRITDQLAIGAMGEYSHTWTSLNPNGHIDVNSGRGGLYASWFNHGIYLDGAIYGGHNNYDSSRSGLGGLASGSTEGAEWSTFISGGYDFHFGQLTVGPIASLQYTYVNIDSFSENGSLAPLAIHSGSAESFRSDFGFRAFYQWKIGKIVVEPSLKAAWEHEYKYSALPITAGFVGIPGPSATFFGPNEGHDSAIVSAGVSVQLTPAISTYVNYDGQLGRGNYDSNAVTGGVRISF